MSKQVEGRRTSLGHVPSSGGIWIASVPEFLNPRSAWTLTSPRTGRAPSAVSWKTRRRVVRSDHPGSSSYAGVLIILSPQGKITRYINGIQYLPFDIKMALIEASDGKVGPTISKLLRFCYAYDPEARTYALNVTRIGGVVVLLLVGVFVAVVVLRPGRKSKEKEATHVPDR